MPKTRQQKVKVLQDLLGELKSAKAATLSSFRAITVKADQSLRKDLRDNGIEYSVIKKTLLRQALKELEYPTDQLESMDGNLSLAISPKDEVTSAKIINKFIKDNSSMTIVGGILENKWIDASKVEALAKLPSRDELIAKTVGTIKAPLSGFVNILAGNVRSLVNVLNAIKGTK